MAKLKKWIRAKKAKTSKAKNLNIQSRLFPTSRVRKTFIKLKQAFVEAPILNHFDLEHHIQIEIDVLCYTISRIFNQLTLDDLC